MYSVKKFKQDGGSQVILRIQNNALLDVLILNRTKEVQGFRSRSMVRLVNHPIVSCVNLPEMSFVFTVLSIPK